MKFNKNNNQYYGTQKLQKYINDKRRNPELKQYRWFKYKFKKCVYKVEPCLKGEDFDETVHRLLNRPREMGEENILTKYMVRKEEQWYKWKCFFKSFFKTGIPIIISIIALFIALFKP